MTAENHETAIELASLPEMVKSFGHVKEKAIAAMETRSRTVGSIRSRATCRIEYEKFPTRFRIIDLISQS
jgi:hypothetical protein